MEPRDKIKDAKTSINARMILLAAGLFLVINAVTTIIQNGLSWFTLADAASGGKAAEGLDVASLLESMENLGITASDLRLIGTACIIICVIRIAAGILCVLFSNRVDKADVTLKVVIALAVCEVIYEVFLFFKKALMLGSLIFSFAIAGFLLWAALKMRELQKAYPERKLAVETTRAASRKVPAAPKKTLHDHAMINTVPEDDTDEAGAEHPEDGTNEAGAEHPEAAADEAEPETPETTADEAVPETRDNTEE